MAHQYLTRFASAFILLAFSITALGKPSKPSAEVLSSITTRGITLAGYDKAAWHASDAVEASAATPTPNSRYIAKKTERGWVVDFGHLDDGGGKFLVSYEAVQRDSLEHFTVTSFEPAREEDTGWNLTAVRGIETALKDFRGVDRPYNVAVLPDEAGNLFVYVYLAQTRAGVYPYGADARYRVSADGRTILERRQLHKTVIEVAPVSPSDNEIAAGYHTHVLTDLPEDTDVLLVLQRDPKVPEFVGAGGFIFKIDVTGKITIESRMTKRQKSD